MFSTIEELTTQTDYKVGYQLATANDEMIRGGYPALYSKIHEISRTDPEVLGTVNPY